MDSANRVNDFHTTQYIMCLFPPLALQEASGVRSTMMMVIMTIMVMIMIVAMMVMIMMMLFWWWRWWWWSWWWRWCRWWWWWWSWWWWWCSAAMSCSSHVTIIFIRAVVREVLYRSSSLHDMRHDGQSVYICTYIYQCIKIQFITIMLSLSQSGGWYLHIHLSSLVRRTE